MSAGPFQNRPFRDLARSPIGRAVYLLKRLGFSTKEIKEMSWQQATFWLESIAYDAEIVAEAVGSGESKETRSLDELVAVLPRTSGEKET